MKKKWMFLIVSTSMLLSACQQLADTSDPGNDTPLSQETEEPGNNKNETEVTTESTLSAKYYRPLLVDGVYQPSKSRGITLRLNSSVNLKEFETGLMRISSESFPTENHLFQEGQVIPADSIRAWLRRNDADNNPEGLNPVDNQMKEPDERAPVYLQSILEQNYYVETENGPRLSGISIGLAMNQVDYYTKEAFGAEFETRIPRDTLVKEGQEMAKEIVQRMREMDKGKDVPIIVALYEQVPRDNLGGGIFISQGISQSNSESIGEWAAIKERKEVFPLTGNDSNEGNSFKNFKSEIESFFPNLSGVTGIADYQNDRLMSLNVSIVTQFYGAGEMVAFTQFVKDAAGKFLPPNIETEIKIESMQGVEAFLFRETGTNTFDAHIFTR